MAEFQEVMQQWRRMCDAYTTDDMKTCCKRCPMDGIGCGAIYEIDSSEGFDVIERKVMAWAAEHPELVYPTFGEWLEKQGIVKLVNSDRYEEDGRKVYILLESVDNNIPADIAEKLGIEPKEDA